MANQMRDKYYCCREILDEAHLVTSFPHCRSIAVCVLRCTYVHVDL